MKPPARKMVKKDDRLDALFDYSRSAPTIMLDDSDDEDVQIIDKIEVRTRRRYSRALHPLQPVQGNFEKPTVTNVVKKVDNDDDWLAPPTKVCVIRGSSQTADPHIYQLRRQKLELLMLSAEMAVESAELEAKAKFALETKARLAPAQPPLAVSRSFDSPKDGENQRQKIVLQLQEQGGKIHNVKIYLDDKFEKLFMIFAEKIAKRPVTEFTFRFDGTALDPQKTPKELELEDEDMIEVNVKTTNAKR